MYEAYEALKIERRGKILQVTLDNPPMNSSTPRMHTELAKIFYDINHDRETSVVVVTGAGGRAFSAGGDIDGMLNRIETRDHAYWNETMLEARHIVNGLLRLEKPLIGRINGHAIGLGATLAVFCDISYMIAKAKIADTHVNVGLTAGDGGSLMWPLLIGFARARHHLLTGEPLTGAKAAEIGLITEAVETIEELDEKVWARAEQLASGPTLAVSTTKIAINMLLRSMMEGVIEAHLGFETMTAWSADHREAVKAFVEKRDPKFGQA